MGSISFRHYGVARFVIVGHISAAKPIIWARIQYSSPSLESWLAKAKTHGGLFFQKASTEFNMVVWILVSLLSLAAVIFKLADCIQNHIKVCREQMEMCIQILKYCIFQTTSGYSFNSALNHAAFFTHRGWGGAFPRSAKNDTPWNSGAKKNSRILPPVCCKGIYG